MKRIVLLMGGVFVLATIAFAVWALGTAEVPGEQKFALDMNRLRQAATASGEPLPVAMEEFDIAHGEFPKAVVVSGAGLFEKNDMVFRTHILGYANGDTVVIDPVHNGAQHQQLFGEGFNEKTWAFMQAALTNASLVLATHEHVDHVGGIAKSPSFASIAPHVKLTEEQINSFAIADADFAPADLQALIPLTYDDYYSPAPGIALKKAPGHSPGSQMIYVQLASGKEYLFIGDIAWSWDNILLQSGRARLVSRFFLGESQALVAAELAALDAVWQQGDVTIIVSHDPNEPQ
ncbi:MAG: MBL fold metallo-hydrolase [Alcanivoracaceae bacterium]|nr:MBL fold metallo-hydrolase [Alcanivoracaceae bacterium]